MHRTVREDALAYLEPALARNHRLELSPKAPGLRPVASAHLEHIAKTFGRDHADLAALALQQRIGTDRRTMHDGRDARKIVGALPDTVQTAGGFLPARRGHLADPGLSARLVEEEQVGKGAADIDADYQTSAHAVPLNP